MAAMPTGKGGDIPWERILDAMDDGVCIMSPDYVVIYQNRSHRNVKGDHVSESCYSAFENQSSICDECPVSETIKSNKPARLVKPVDSNDTRNYIDVTASPIFDDDGRIVAVVETLKDVTSTVDLHEDVTRSEELFRQLAENVPGVVWMRGRSHEEVLYLSPGFENIWGRDRETVYRDPGLWFEFMHEDDRERVRELIEMEVFGKREDEDVSYNVEYRIVRPSGEIRWIKSRGFSVKDKYGKVYRYAGIADDITENKTAEERRDEIFAMLRHDLRTPLTVMDANLDMVIAGLDRERDSEAISLLLAVRSKVRSMATMIDDLSMIARAESPGMPVNFVPQKISDMVEEAMVFMRDRMKAKGLKLEKDIDPALRPVELDRVSFQRAVTNLIQNAINYTPAGGTIRVGVKGESQSASGKVCWQKVSISDNGPGIPEHVRDKVFKKYFRHDKGNVEGTGLGLAIVKAVAEAHGGWVELDTDEGRGSTFTIIVPCYR